MVTLDEKLTAAKEHVAGRIIDIIEKNFDTSGAALDTGGTFTAYIEAYRAIEIAEKHKRIGYDWKAAMG